MMNEAALVQWRHLVGKGTGRARSIPPHLTPEEQAAFAICAQQNMRLEQERIPHNHVVRVCHEIAR
jgi:hypothetical protein